METAVALPQSRENIKEPISALPNYDSKGKFGARRAELRNILQGKWRGRGGSSCRFDHRVRVLFLFCGQCNTGDHTHTQLHLPFFVLPFPVTYRPEQKTGLFTNPSYNGSVRYGSTRSLEPKRDMDRTEP